MTANTEKLSEAITAAISRMKVLRSRILELERALVQAEKLAGEYSEMYAEAVSRIKELEQERWALRNAIGTLASHNSELERGLRQAKTWLSDYGPSAHVQELNAILEKGKQPNVVESSAARSGGDNG